jgi:hypothetical protein
MGDVADESSEASINEEWHSSSSIVNETLNFRFAS